MIRYFLLIILTSSLAHAEAKLSDHDHFTLFISHNVDSRVQSTSLEFGVNLPRSQPIRYVPYIGVFLRNTRLPLELVEPNTTDSSKRTNSAIIGAKLGLIFPVRNSILPFAIFAAIAGGSSSVQNNPWWGYPKNSLSDEALMEASLGLRFAVKDYYLGYDYSVSNINYLYNNHLLMLGVSF